MHFFVIFLHFSAKSAVFRIFHPRFFYLFSRILLHKATLTAKERREREGVEMLAEHITPKMGISLCRVGDWVIKCINNAFYCKTICIYQKIVVILHPKGYKKCRIV